MPLDSVKIRRCLHGTPVQVGDLFVASVPDQLDPTQCRLIWGADATRVAEEVDAETAGMGVQRRRIDRRRRKRQ